MQFTIAFTGVMSVTSGIARILIVNGAFTWRILISLSLSLSQRRIDAI